jgi:HK97 family phage portal protein
MKTQLTTKTTAPWQRKTAVGRAFDRLGSWIGNTRPVQLLLSSAFGWLDSHRNFSGEPVNYSNALQLSTVWACVRLLSETISTLPLNLYKDKKGEKVVADEHPLHTILHTSPNDDSTAVVFWQAFIASLLLRGGAYVEVFRSATGSVTSMVFLTADNLSGPDQDGIWSYIDPATGRTREIPDRRIWYTPFFTIDGRTGVTPISCGANVFGGAIAADRASADTFKNGMRASGLVMMDHVMKPEQRADVRRHSEEVVRQGGIFVLEKGSTFQQLNMTPQDSQLLSTRHFNVEEICRWFRVAPFMVGHNDKASGYPASLEAQMIMFMNMTLRPIVVGIEQSINKYLLTAVERKKYSAEFVIEGILRGDSASRAAFYNAGVTNGWMTRDEVRRKENLPVKGGNADQLMVQSQMIPIDKVGEEPVPAPKAPPAQGDPDASMDEASEAVAEAAKSLFSRLSIRETKEL